MRRPSIAAARSAVQLGVGVVVVGLSGFAFLALVGHSMSTRDKVALTSLYMMINVVGPGLFVALEQETNRVVSTAVAAGRDPHDGLWAIGRLGAAMAGLAMAIVLVASPVLVERTLGGRTSLIVWLLLGIVSAAGMYGMRGVLGGRFRFPAYAGTLVVEGLTRLIPCLAIAAVGWAAADLYGAALATGGVWAALLGWHWIRSGPGYGHSSAHSQGQNGRDGRLGGLARGLAWLAVATVLAQVMANLAPLVVNGRLAASGGQDAKVAAAFGFAFVLTRVPLLLFSPLQAMLLPSLTGTVVRRDVKGVRDRLAMVLLAIVAVGIPGALGCGVLGPWAVETFFGTDNPPSGAVMALLGLSTVLLMVIQVLQPALVAAGRHHLASIAWVAGSVVLIGLLALPIDPITAAVVAQLTGPTIVVIIAAVGLNHALVNHVGSGRRAIDTAETPGSVATQYRTDDGAGAGRHLGDSPCAERGQHREHSGQGPPAALP